MSEFSLRLKFDGNEFEARGAVDDVRRAAERFYKVATTDEAEAPTEPSAADAARPSETVGRIGGDDRPPPNRRVKKSDREPRGTTLPPSAQTLLDYLSGLDRLPKTMGVAIAAAGLAAGSQSLMFKYLVDRAECRYGFMDGGGWWLTLPDGRRLESQPGELQRRRKCLGCGGLFDSAGSHERQCPACRTRPEGQSDAPAVLHAP